MKHGDNIEPRVRVGVMSANSIVVDLHGEFVNDKGVLYRDTTVTVCAGQQRAVFLGDDAFDVAVTLTPADESCYFTLHDVIIGVSFHWKRAENQSFKGAVEFMSERDGEVTAINVLSVEDYLLSVISSEMSAHASLELLKAHAVISRSWLLAQIMPPVNAKHEYIAAADVEGLRWWDHDDHENFDVCADDHCQRYQGITRASTPTVAQAIAATRGEVLVDSEGSLCDARFSKSCGGVMEQFEYCWQPERYDYLVARADCDRPHEFPDLTREDEATRWIMSAPEAYCNTHDPAILSQVLNDYDRETTDFYRWHVTYTARQLTDLLLRRTGDDYGRVRSLEPLARGTSGRLWQLRVVGERLTRVIGKELAIRYALSESCLYSSAFVVETGEVDADGYPETFTLHGAGWGHGVGLCQIGAAVMGARGIGYRDILSHYFPGSRLAPDYAK